MHSGNLRRDTVDQEVVAVSELRAVASEEQAWHETTPPAGKVRVMRNVADEPATLIRVVLSTATDPDSAEASD